MGSIHQDLLLKSNLQILNVVLFLLQLFFQFPNFSLQSFNQSLEGFNGLKFGSMMVVSWLHHCRQAGADQGSPSARLGPGALFRATARSAVSCACCSAPTPRRAQKARRWASPRGQTALPCLQGHSFTSRIRRAQPSQEGSTQVSSSHMVPPLVHSWEASRTQSRQKPAATTGDKSTLQQGWGRHLREVAHGEQLIAKSHP